MDADTVSCRIFKLHKYDTVYENKKYHIERCNICGAYTVLYKEYDIKSKFKSNELPYKITGVLT